MSAEKNEMSEHQETKKNDARNQKSTKVTSTAKLG